MPATAPVAAVTTLAEASAGGSRVATVRSAKRPMSRPLAYFLKWPSPSTWSSKGGGGGGDEGDGGKDEGDGEGP